MKHVLLSVIAVACLLSATSSAQLITIGTGTIQNGQYTYPAPYGNWYYGSRHQFMVTQAELIAAGAPPGGIIAALAWDVTSVLGQPLANFEIKLGQTTLTSVGTGWIPGTISALTPTPYTATVGWNTHTLNTPFVWNGVDNLVIETCHNNTSYTLNCIVNQSATTYLASRAFWQDASGVCGNPSPGNTYLQRPNVQITFQAAIPIYEVNKPGSTMDIDGVITQGYSAAVTTRCTNAIANVNFQSNAPASPWEVLVGFQPLISATGGAFYLTPTQMINVNLGDPFAFFLNGGTSPSLLPFPGSFVYPFFTGGSPLTISVQQVNVDGSAPDGLALSQGCQLNILAGGGTVPGPAGDDTSIALSLAASPPFCGPGSVPVYGTGYTTIQVVSNGRLMFGTPNLSWTPTSAAMLTDSPSFGLWTDFNPAAGGTITCSQPVPGLIRVDWAAVQFFANPVPNTFAIMIDIGGTITFDGLPGLGVAGLGQLIGASAGNTGATDPGPTTFAIGGPNVGPPGLGMLYQLGTAGGMTVGMTQIQLLPSFANPGNYDWIAL